MQKIFKHFLGILAIILAVITFLGSKSSQSVSYKSATIKLEPKKDEIFTKPSLSEYLHSTKSPTIVLRVPAQIDNVLEEGKYSKNQIYYTIEKELAKADFIVRDRALYQKVLDQNISTDYSKIKDLTNTDLILEFVGFERTIFNTNSYIDKKGREKINSLNFQLFGTRIEFKLIQVKNNDLVGTYTFYNSPCTSGCNYDFDNEGKLYSKKIKGNTIIRSYETFSADSESAIVEFVKQSALRLITELKK